MLKIFYEDGEVIVVEKPAGVESQARHSFEPDMVSEIRNHIRETAGAAESARKERLPDGGSAAPKSHRISPSAEEPYVGVIHRLDKPVSGIMVYAKTKKAAAALSAQIQAGRVKKTYRAVVCGRCVDNVGNFVDYLLKAPEENRSKIVEKGIIGAKRAELRYRVLGELDEVPAWAGHGPLTLVETELLTGRHHQIRAQFAGHGLPLWGDARYGAQSEGPGRYGNPALARGTRFAPHRLAERNLALCACGLTFEHPSTGRAMTFAMKPETAIFGLFEE